MTALTTAALLAIDAMPEPELADQIRMDLRQESPGELDFCHDHLHRTNGSPPAGTGALGQSSACSRRERHADAGRALRRGFGSICGKPSLGNRHGPVTTTSNGRIKWSSLACNRPQQASRAAR